MGDKTAIQDANAAYYRAFATADFAAMSRIWAEDNVSCVHPGWPALVGRQAILGPYREILRNPNQEWIEYRDEIVIVSGDEARVLCVEFVGGTGLAATNMSPRWSRSPLRSLHRSG
jgi:ketosteroid isomerase-like protein